MKIEKSKKSQTTSSSNTKKTQSIQHIKKPIAISQTIGF
jgi:hypothetical protein